jgi:hypothetical protein
MNQHVTPEQLRQHQAHALRQARLWNTKPKPKPVALVQVEATRRPAVEEDYHVILYRLHRANYPVEMQTCASFSVLQSEEYLPWKGEVSIVEAPPSRKTMKHIAMEVMKEFPGVRLDEVRGHRRERILTRPRHRVMYEIKMQQPWRSFPEIGRFMNRDHTVALYAYYKLRAEMDGDKECARKIETKRKRELASRPSRSKAKANMEGVKP